MSASVRKFLHTCKIRDTTIIKAFNVVNQRCKSYSTRKLSDGPSLKHFIAQSLNSNANHKDIDNDVGGSDAHAVGYGQNLQNIGVNRNRMNVNLDSDFPTNGMGSNLTEEHPYIAKDIFSGRCRKVYFETYGCQMNVNDTEIVWSVLNDSGFERTTEIKQADVILLMTCSIREGAEKKIWGRVDAIQGLKRSGGKGQSPVKIGILGCMAERLKSQILEEKKSVDLVCGPDAYKDLPRLLSITHSGQTAVNVMLSLDETYADVMPIRMNENSPSAFVGRERSRPLSSILDEVRALNNQGIKEVTLLGQNVNSYRDLSEFKSTENPIKTPTNLAKGFKTIYKTKVGGLRFSDLLDQVSQINPEMRIRFTSPHPKDFPDEVLELIKERPNICNQIHIPAQSGSTAVLESMRRGYSREAYLELVQHIKQQIPDIKLSSDFISGFCGESEQDHEDTMTMLDIVRYHRVFHFPYSLREKTHAHRRLTDDVPSEVKQRRHEEIGVKCRQIFTELNNNDIGQTQLVLVESASKRSADEWAGRNDGNTRVIFPKLALPDLSDPTVIQSPGVGDYVAVRITGGTSQTLRGEPLYTTNLTNFSSHREDLIPHPVKFEQAF